MEFDVTRAIPINTANDRQPQFDASRAVPVVEQLDQQPEQKKEGLADKVKNIAGKMVEQRLKTSMLEMKIIRWPFWRFIEHPVSTVVSALQEPGKEPAIKTAGKALQAFVPFKKIPEEEYGSYGKIWDKYFQDARALAGQPKMKTPDWYVALASYGTAMGIEVPAINAAGKLTELAATRVATAEEATTIRGYFQPLKQALEKGGLKTKDLYAEGNIIKVDGQSEIFINKYLSAVLRGGQVRVPRWAKIKIPKQISGPPKLAAPAEGALTKTGIVPESLPVTGPEVVLKAAPALSVPKVSSLKKISVEDFNQPQAPLKAEKIKVDPALIDKINKMQDILGKQLKVTSGYRTPEYNKLLESQGYKIAEKSLHLEGKAADILVTKELTHEKLMDAAKKVGLDIEDISLTPKHIHLEIPTEGTPTKLYQFETKAEIKSIMPDIIEKLSDKINALKTKEEKFDMAKSSLEEINTLRGELKNSIRSYKGDYLAEEISEIPKYYKSTKSTSMAPDEAMQYLRDNYGMEIANETDLVEYLRKLDSVKDSLSAQIEENKPSYVRMQEITNLKQRVTDVSRGIREGKSMTLQEAKAVQDEVISKIESMKLPPEQRAKFLRTVKNIQTKEQFEKSMGDLTERLGLLSEKITKQQLAEDIKDISIKAIDLDYRDMIDEIKHGLDLDRRTKKTMLRRERSKEFIQRMEEKGEPINIPQDQLDLLEKTNFHDMTIEEAQEVHDTVVRLAHLGKLKNKLIASADRRGFENIKAEMIDTISGGKGISEDSSFVKYLRENNKSFKDASLDAVKSYMIENLRPELMINILDKMQRGIATQKIFDPLWESQKVELEGSQAALEKIKDIHKNINFAEVFVKKYKVGRYEGVTKNNAMMIYAHAQNEHGLDHLYGSGITDADIADVSNFLSEAEKQAISTMQTEYYGDLQYPKIDEVYSALEGIHLPEEINYFPIDRLEDISYAKELESNILKAKYLRRAGVSKGFTKERVQSKKGFSDFDYFGTILRNMKKVEHYVAYGKSVRDANKLLSNVDVKNAIKDNYGDKFYNVIEKWLKDVAYGGDRAVVSSIENISKWIRTNYATAVIGGNLVSVSKAPLSFMQGAEMVGLGNAMKSTLKILRNPIYWNDWIDRKSTLMKFRPMRQERELMEITAQRNIGQQIGKVSGYQAMREYSMMPWVIADKATCNTIWLSAYDLSIEGGLSEAAAIDYADMVIRRTQPMSGALNLPDTFRGPEYQKLFTLFRNQPNQNFNLILESVMKKKAGDIGPEKFSKDMVFYWIVPAMMLGMINRKGIQRNISELSKDLLNGALGGLIYIGNLTNMFATGYKGTTTPLDSLYEDIYGFTMTKDKWKKIDRFVVIMSKLLGIPYIGIKRLLKGEIYGPPKKEKSNKLRD